MAAAIGKDILGAAGKAPLNHLGSKLLKEAGIVLQDEKNAQNLEKAVRMLEEIKAKLDAITTQLNKITVDTDIIALTTPYQELSTWFDQVTRTMRRMAQELKNLALNPNDADARRELQVAREAFRKRGGDIAYQLETKCNTIDELMTGSTGRTGAILNLFVQSRGWNRDLFQHYIFMKSFCIRYWTAMMKARTMMIWFSNPNSGVHFRTQSTQEEISAADALDKIEEQLVNQDNILQNAMGKLSYHFCTFFVNNPEGMWTGFSTAGVTFDRSGRVPWMPRSTDPCIPTKWDGFEYHRIRNLSELNFTIGGWRNAAQKVLDPCRAEVVCKVATTRLGPHYTFGWAIGGQGFHNNMNFSDDQQYTFWIMRRDPNYDYLPDRYLRFGLDGSVPGAADLARYAVLTADKAGSSWRILAPLTNPDEILIKYHNPNLPEHDHFIGANLWECRDQNRNSWDTGQRFEGGPIDLLSVERAGSDRIESLGNGRHCSKRRITRICCHSFHRSCRNQASFTQECRCLLGTAIEASITD